MSRPVAVACHDSRLGEQIIFRAAYRCSGELGETLTTTRTHHKNFCRGCLLIYTLLSTEIWTEKKEPLLGMISFALRGRALSSTGKSLSLKTVGTLSDEH